QTWALPILPQPSRLGQVLDPVADRLYILAVVIGLALRDIVPWWFAVILPLRDVFLWVLVAILRTRGYSALPVHFLGKAATFNLLYAFPLLLLGDGTGAGATLAKVFGWAFAIWGIGLYWWAGILYAYQVYKLVKSTERRGVAHGGRPVDAAAARARHPAAAVADHPEVAGRRLRARRRSQERGRDPP